MTRSNRSARAAGTLILAIDPGHTESGWVTCHYWCQRKTGPCTTGGARPVAERGAGVYAPMVAARADIASRPRAGLLISVPAHKRPARGRGGRTQPVRFSESTAYVPHRRGRVAPCQRIDCDTHYQRTVR